MKICIVTETYPPEINGVAMTLHKIVQGLKDIGHKITIIRPHQKGQSLKSIDENETIVPSLPIPGYKGLHFGLPCRTRLRNLWKKDMPDIIYIATEGPLGLSAINVAKKFHIPITSGFHTNFHKYMKHYKLPLIAKLAARFLRKTHNQTLRTFAPTKGVIRQLNAMGVNNTRLLSRGVDSNFFNPNKRCNKLRNSWGLNEENQFAAIFVSRIAPEKNIPLAIESFKIILKNNPNNKCILIGDGPEKEKLQKKYPEFIFTGMLKGEALSKYYASGDLFIFPSLTETFGNVIPEALSSALIPIAYNYAAPKELIKNSHNGYLAQYGNKNDFLKKVEEAISNKNNWASLKFNARKTAAELKWPNIINDFSEELRLAVNETLPK